MPALKSLVTSSLAKTGLSPKAKASQAPAVPTSVSEFQIDTNQVLLLQEPPPSELPPLVGLLPMPTELPPDPAPVAQCTFDLEA